MIAHRLLACDVNGGKVTLVAGAAGGVGAGTDAWIPPGNADFVSDQALLVDGGTSWKMIDLD